MAKNNNRQSKDDHDAAKIFLLDKFVCNFIKTEWLSDGKSNLSQSKEYGVHPHILKKIKGDDGYRIPLSSLAIILFYRKISLSDFFLMIEEKYGSRINDDFVNKENKKY